MALLGGWAQETNFTLLLFFTSIPPFSIQQKTKDELLIFINYVKI